MHNCGDCHSPARLCWRFADVLIQINRPQKQIFSATVPGEKQLHMYAIQHTWGVHFVRGALSVDRLITGWASSFSGAHRAEDGEEQDTSRAPTA